jgi:hypothetical protein
MPLTEDNINLMPPGFYQNYLNKVTALTTSHKALLLNLNDPKIFPQKYFTDSVHLNARGGEHFFQVLADRLKADPETAAIISQAGVEREIDNNNNAGAEMTHEISKGKDAGSAKMQPKLTRGHFRSFTKERHSSRHNQISWSTP